MENNDTNRSKAYLTQKENRHFCCVPCRRALCSILTHGTLPCWTTRLLSWHEHSGSVAAWQSSTWRTLACLADHSCFWVTGGCSRFGVLLFLDPHPQGYTVPLVITPLTLSPPATALKMNMNLRELYLADNKLNGLQDSAQLGNLLKFNYNIQILDLRNNHILDSGVTQ